MLGYEIKINDEYLHAAIDQGNLTVILTNRIIAGDEDISLHVGGLDTKDGLDTVWLNKKQINEGDEIVITIKNLQNITSPETVTHLDGKQLQTDRLQGFYQLQSELQQEGLI